MKKILLISGVPDGMKKFFFEKEIYIEGMPAYANTLFTLIKKGYEVHLLCFSNKEFNLPIIDNLNVYRINVKMGNKPSKILSIIKALFKCIALNRKIKFDLIYGHGDIGFLAGVLSPIIRVPNIRRLYGTFLYYYIDNGSFPGKIKAFRERTFDYLAFSLPTSALIITNDGTHGDKVANMLGQKSSKIYHLYNGVDHSLAKKVDAKYAERIIGELKKDEHQSVIVSMSRLAEWKRVDRAINAVKFVNHRPRPLLVIIGDGPLRQELEDLVHKLELEEYVYFLGRIQQEKALSIIAHADISLSLYDYANLGNVLIESMILGKCIVSLDDGSLGGVIENGYNGVLVKKPEPQLIAKEIDDLLANPDRIKLYGKNAMDRSFEIFDIWDERIKKEIDIIENVTINNYAIPTK